MAAVEGAELKQVSLAFHPARQVDEAPSVPHDSRWYAIALYGLFFTGYFALGAVLNIRYNVIDGDGLARVANAGYVTMSRSPHLSAIGFVWNPLPSLVEIPLVPLSHFWPVVKTHGLAGVAQSAMFMAASALLIRRIALDRGVGTLWTWIALGCFVLHPMVVLNAGYGLSEAATLFAALWCIRRLLLWVDTRRPSDLAWVGIALAIGYLSRYEILVAVVGVAALVIVVAYRGSKGRGRRSNALLSMLIVVFPSAVTFAVWAIAGWIITGDMFAQFSSIYGNASQVSVAHERSGDTMFTTGNWRLILALLLAMQPLAGIAIAVAVISAVRHRTAAPIVPLAVLGPMLAFTVWGQLSGSTFNLFRYYMPAIPLVIVVALVLRAPSWSVEGSDHGSLPGKRLAAAMLCASLVIGIPLTFRSMFSNELGLHQQLRGFTSLFDGPGGDPAQFRQVGLDDRLVAAYLDRLNLPEATVLMDTFTSWLIWLASSRPRQFVVTSDYDFDWALNQPADYGIRYIVVNTPSASAANAIQIRYPSIWEDGAGIGTLVYAVNGPTGHPRWRVFEIHGGA
ncbi:MAG: hypothetical protein U5N53_00370 [Mycobacterium sp.]|nr:hypothetical protein [Mycobacterium sp.]